MIPLRTVNSLWKLAFILLFILNTNLQVAKAQTNKPKIETTRILFIFDMSRSMLGEWQSGRKIDVAKRMMVQLLDSLKNVPNVQVALRMYGHQSPIPPQDCSDTRLEVPFGPNNWDLVKNIMLYTTPKGTTPIANSLLQCADDFPPCSTCRNIIILITDGVEACDGDPCAIAQTLHKKGITIKPYVIGIGLDVELIDAFKCIGTYYDARTEKSFQEVLQTVVNQAAIRTTLQVNLLDVNGQPTETGVNMSFYNSKTGELKYNYIHTINDMNVPDTVEVDPTINYKIVVHTIPATIIDNIKISPGRHNVVSKTAAQGYIQLVEDVSNAYKEAMATISETGECNHVHIQQMGETEKYLVGKYDVEVQTWPRLVFKDVEVKQGGTTVLKIPQPGIVTIVLPAEGFASLYQVSKGEAIWVMNLNKTGTKTVPLLPGKYFAVFRPVKMKKTLYTQEKHFEVKSGYSNHIKF